MIQQQTAINLVCVVLVVPSDCSAQTEDEHLGLTEYEFACMPCHGVNGSGGGPLAKGLRTPPSDLSLLAKSNGGNLPTSKIIEFIDSRAAVAAHGARDMPVWGNRYRIPVVPGEPRRDIERRAVTQLNGVVRYREAIQRRRKSACAPHNQTPQSEW